MSKERTDKSQPFDLQRANSGEEVEAFMCHSKQWVSLGFNSDTSRYDMGIFDWLSQLPHDANPSEEMKTKLRMKYPEKVS
jgi:hypothetical protein